MTIKKTIRFDGKIYISTNYVDEKIRKYHRKVYN